MKVFSKLLLASIVLALLAACSPAAANPSQPALEVSDAVVNVPGGSSMGGMDMPKMLGGFMKIHNNSGTADRLLGVTCDFATVMLHETTMNGDVASMSEVSSIEIPANSSVELKHGGYHIMFADVKRELKAGDKVNLTLQFEKAGTVTVVATVVNQ